MSIALEAAALPPGLLAAGLIDAIGPLLVVAFWVIRQVLVSLKEQREIERARQAADERGEPWPPAGKGGVADEVVLEEPAAARAELADPPPQPAPQPAQADLRSEVEEFLRRASNPGAAPAPQPKEKRSLDPFDDRPTRKRRPVTRQPSVQPTKAQQSSTVERRVERPPTAARVSLRHLPESQLAENAAHLGESIATADDRVEARLHDKFDHRLGSLAGRTAGPAAAATEPVTTAARIRQTLTKPGGAREAVILSEILRYPPDLI